MARKPWMYTGDIKEGVTYEMRPGVERDRYARPDELVWRYMPLSHLLDAIRAGSLFFTRLSHFAVHGDRLEGSTPRPFVQMREQVLRERGVDIDAYNRESARFHLQMLQTVLVNCWHKREHEAAPMWERYGHRGDSAAIVSTLDRLVNAMPEEVTVGHVDYVDFATDGSFSANPFSRAFMKSRTLEDEREVRAVLSEPPVTENGRWSITLRPGEEIGHTVPVDIRTLIMRVVMSPTSPGSRERVMEELARVSIDAVVENSELAAPPRY